MSDPFRVFIDDIRDPDWVTWVALPPGSWMIVRSYTEFTSLIEKAGIPSFVAFDHDLGAEHYDPAVKESEYTEKTGRDCASWLIDRCLDLDVTIPEYVVHSQNPVGRENIIFLMESAIAFQAENRSIEHQLRRTD